MEVFAKHSAQWSELELDVPARFYKDIGALATAFRRRIPILKK
jgi:hypothetical protein